jgi:hypothetical protein
LFSDTNNIYENVIFSSFKSILDCDKDKGKKEAVDAG